MLKALVIKQIIACKHNTLIALLMSGILLVLTGCSIQKGNNAGRINGTNIKELDFMNSLRGHFTGFILEKDRTPDDNEKKELYTQTWRDITIHVILKDYFKKYNIQVTPQEVTDTLLNNIPPSIMKAPIFITDGKFDRTKYVQTLLSESTKQLDWLRKYYYEYYIPLAKLKQELQEEEIVSTSGRVS